MSDELQVGQSVDYTIAGKKIVLKPMALGRMKKATAIFADKTGDNVEIIAKYLQAILDNDANQDLTLEWIMENVTMPQAQDIMKASKTINGLGSFFPTGGAPTPAVKVERPLEETVPPTPSV